MAVREVYIPQRKSPLNDFMGMASNGLTAYQGYGALKGMGLFGGGAEAVGGGAGADILFGGTTGAGTTAGSYGLGLGTGAGTGGGGGYSLGVGSGGGGGSFMGSVGSALGTAAPYLGAAEVGREMYNVGSGRGGTPMMDAFGKAGRWTNDRLRGPSHGSTSGDSGGVGSLSIQGTEGGGSMPDIPTSSPGEPSSTGSLSMGNNVKSWGSDSISRRMSADSISKKDVLDMRKQVDSMPLARADKDSILGKLGDLLKFTKSIKIG